MHELSIALSLVDAACDELPRLSRTERVRAIRVRVGLLSGVACEALAFAFDLAASDSPIAGARLEIETTAVRVFCGGCRSEQVIRSAALQCPVCGAPTPDIVAGRELELTALEVCDDAADR